MAELSPAPRDMRRPAPGNGGRFWVVQQGTGVKIVARYLDGRVRKGATSDFFPNKDVFHLVEESGETVSIRRDDLKAVFFVKSLEGDPEREDDMSFEGKSGQGRKLEVRFRDGEVIAGFTMGFSRERPGFFVFPVDEEGNNSRVFVVTRAVESVRFVP